MEQNMEQNTEQILEQEQKNETEKPKKVKKVIPENGCSRIRWVITFILSFIIGSLIGGVMAKIITEEVAVFKAGGSLAFLAEYMNAMITFFFCFLVTIFFIKKIAKTSFRSFVLGTARVKHTREVWEIIGLYVVGVAIGTIPTIGNVTVTTAPVSHILITIVAALIFTWFQTTTEEMWFRGIFARFAYGDDIKKPFCAGTFFLVLFSSVTFMAMHIANPEVQTSSGTDVIFSILTYLIPGIMLMVSDLYLGTLEAGIGIHWINNFLGFTVLGAEVSAGASPTIFIDHTTVNKGFWALIGTVIAYAPVLIYIIVKSRKNRENN